MISDDKGPSKFRNWWIHTLLELRLPRSTVRSLTVSLLQPRVKSLQNTSYLAQYKSDLAPHRGEFASCKKLEQYWRELFLYVIDDRLIEKKRWQQQRGAKSSEIYMSSSNKVRTYANFEF